MSWYLGTFVVAYQKITSSNYISMTGHSTFEPRIEEDQSFKLDFRGSHGCEALATLFFLFSACEGG